MMNFTPEQITAYATLITAIGALVYAVRGDSNSRRNTIQGAVNEKKIEEIKVATDGMKTELVNEVRTASGLAGEKRGAAEEKAARESKDAHGPHSS